MIDCISLIDGFTGSERDDGVPVPSFFHIRAGIAIARDSDFIVVVAILITIR